MDLKQVGGALAIIEAAIVESMDTDKAAQWLLKAAQLRRLLVTADKEARKQAAKAVKAAADALP